MAGGFLEVLRICEIDDDDCHWRLLEPCVYWLKALPNSGGTEFVEAPKDFVTDFGSIPQVFWNLPGLSPFGRYRRAYVIHDKLYVAPVVRTMTSARAITRGEADNILEEAMGVLGANWLVRKTVLSAVRMGGWVPWNRYRKVTGSTTEESS
jgi:hypothetical protein